jgi:diacylglycerol kinase family enzyme
VLAHPTHPSASGVVSLHDADRVAIRCDRPLPLQVDGEDLGDVTELRLEAERDALTVLV